MIPELGRKLLRVGSEYGPGLVCVLHEDVLTLNVEDQAFENNNL